MSYKLHILIDHEATNVSEALGLTKQQKKEFQEKVIDLAIKVSEIMLGETDNRVKKTQIMEEIQENFSPAEILLLAAHDIEAQAVKICEIQYNPLGMLAALSHQHLVIKKNSMYRFHISYKDNNINDYFLRGVNIILNTNDFKQAIDQFHAEHNNCEIAGIVVVLNN